MWWICLSVPLLSKIVTFRHLLVMYPRFAHLFTHWLVTIVFWLTIVDNSQRSVISANVCIFVLYLINVKVLSVNFILSNMLKMYSLLGAFIPTVPVQPVVIRYPNKLVRHLMGTWAMKPIRALQFLIKWINLIQFGLLKLGQCDLFCPNLKDTTYVSFVAPSIMFNSIARQSVV